MFEAASHDEIFGIVELIRKNEILDEEVVTPFIVGQKLFGEAVKENRTNPLFSEFCPQRKEKLCLFKY